MIKKWEKN